MSDLKLFEIEDGSTTYWLGAGSAREALKRYLSEVPDARFSYVGGGAKVREVGAEESEVPSYVDEGGHRLRSMGEQLQIQGRDMIACSEW